MVARDDSVIRGSLIACLIFLVLSIALNFFLWRWGDTQSQEASRANQQYQTVQSNLRTLETQASRMKAMLGVGGFTEAEIDEMKQNTSSDPEMQAIEDQFAKDMSYFGAEVEAQNRNYPNLPEYLVNAIRDRNMQYRTARDEATKIRTDADADIQNARTQQQLAETQRDDANKKLVTLSDQFDQDRTRMNQEKEETRDQLAKTVLEFNQFRTKASDETNRLAQKARQLQGTIDTQKLQLNRMRADKFETTQGEIRYVVRGGNVTTINLGSADALRPGVTFGVIDGDETRLQDAKVKATIQVTQIQGPHLAQARVVALPEIRNPIIPGDKIYSPFWAPGRVVKIALAGDIDIDGDDKPDNDAIKGQIKAAGAEVAAEISPSGAVTGDLDASIRFLVVGEAPNPADGQLSDAQVQQVATMGAVKAKAAELGLTVIPAWKLQNYLRTLDDTLTTPLGSAVRGEDFPPESANGINFSRMPTDIAEIYKRQDENLQRGTGVSDILSP
jgi:hypothetical protein